MRITEQSHTDHILAEHLQIILSLFGDRDDAFAIETLQLPAGSTPLMSGLYGPIAGDEPVPESEVFYDNRTNRDWNSRLVNRPLRATLTMTIIFGQYKNKGCILFTAYGGKPTPKEVDDPTLGDHEKEQSATFWKEHALSALA